MLMNKSLVKNLLISGSALLALSAIGTTAVQSHASTIHHISTYSTRNHNLFSYHQVYRAYRIASHHPHTNYSHILLNRINKTIINNMHHYRYYQLKHLNLYLTHKALTHNNQNKFNHYYNYRTNLIKKVSHHKAINFLPKHKTHKTPNFLPKSNSYSYSSITNALTSNLNHNDTRSKKYQVNLNNIVSNIGQHLNTYTPKQIDSLSNQVNYFAMNAKLNQSNSNIASQLNYHHNQTLGNQKSRAIANNQYQSQGYMSFASNHGNDKFAQQVTDYVIKDINNDRQQYGLKPLAVNVNAQRIAQVRAGLVYEAYSNEPVQYEFESDDGNNTDGDNMVHGMDSHNTSYDVAHRLGIKTGYGIGENVSAIQLADYKIDSDPEGDASHYEHNDNPKEVAYNIVNDMVNYDKYTNNGHRYNILSKDATGIGVCTYHGNGKNINGVNGGIAMEFSNGNDYQNI